MDYPLDNDHNQLSILFGIQDNRKKNKMNEFQEYSLFSLIFRLMTPTKHFHHESAYRFKSRK